MKLLLEKIRITFGFLFGHPLGKRHPLKVLFRFAYWQIQSRAKPTAFIIKTFIGPVKFFARKGLTGVTGNIYTGLHDFTDMGFLLHFLRPEDLFMDIGANAGSYTLLASGICHASSISIEPSKTTVTLLRDNILLNHIQGRVMVVNKVAGAKKDVLTFSKNHDTTNHVLRKEEIGNALFETVEVIPVDDITVDHHPVLIKIDVEGYETEVLKGMKNTLGSASLKGIIIELNGGGTRYGFNEDDIHQLLLANGFRPYLYDPFKRELCGIPSHGDVNTIYCRDMDFVNSRIQTGPKFKVMGEVI